MMLSTPSPLPGGEVASGSERVRGQSNPGGRYPSPGSLSLATLSRRERVIV